MKRRMFLASAGIGFSTAAAGCTSQAVSSRSPEADTEKTANTSESTQNETDQKSAQTLIKAGDTAERTIGAGSLDTRSLRKPHHVAFRNPTEETHHGTITISTASETVFEESIEFEANTSLIASLSDLNLYTVRVAVPTLDATKEVTVEPDQFICNVTKTTISVREDRTLGSMSVSTRMACPGVVSKSVPADERVSHTLGEDSTSTDSERGSHTLVLRNSSDETWTARMLVENDSTAQFDGVYTVGPAGTVLITLGERGTYTLSVDVLETEGTITEQATPENFDCNQSSTQVNISAGGELTGNTLSTLMACSTEVNSTNESS
ncbi:hypothetical protein EXE41_12935 [Halorubrum sp. SD690R]|nr:hypothetical protein EXE41_12935 [Halorubrum sp. SD690R]